MTERDRHRQNCRHKNPKEISCQNVPRIDMIGLMREVLRVNIGGVSIINISPNFSQKSHEHTLITVTQMQRKFTRIGVAHSAIAIGKRTAEEKKRKK